MNKIKKNGAKLSKVEQQKLYELMKTSKLCLKQEYPWKCDKELTTMINSSLKTALCMSSFEKMVAYLKGMQINSIPTENAYLLWEKKKEIKNLFNF